VEQGPVTEVPAYRLSVTKIGKGHKGVVMILNQPVETAITVDEFLACVRVLGSLRTYCVLFFL